MNEDITEYREMLQDMAKNCTIRGAVTTPESLQYLARTLMSQKSDINIRVPADRLDCARVVERGDEK